MSSSRLTEPPSFFEVELMPEQERIPARTPSIFEVTLRFHGLCGSPGVAEFDGDVSGGIGRSVLNLQKRQAEHAYDCRDRHKQQH